MMDFDHNFYPTSNDRATNIALLDSRLIRCESVTSLTHVERWRILQNYFPRSVVDEYCLMSSSGGGLTAPKKYDISHDEVIEALQKAPHLVLEETPIEPYLLQICGSTKTTDKNVIKEAATKIAIHWKFRKYFFQERAFLPLAQTRNGFEGALSEEDMEWLDTGFNSILPPSVDPTKNRCVAVLDVTRLPPYQNSSAKYENIKVRVGFYMAYVASRTHEASSKGLVVVSVIGSKPAPYFCNWSLWMGCDVLPLKHCELHWLFLPSRIVTELTSFMSFIVSAAYMILGIWFGSCLYSVNVHFGCSDESVAQKLASTGGFNLEDLPTWIGGKFSMERLQEWHRQQLQLEESRYSALQCKTVTRKVRDVEKERSKRRRTTARKTRTDATSLLEDLQAQVKILREVQVNIKNENKMLENMLEYTKEELYVLDGLENELEDESAQITNPEIVFGAAKGYNDVSFTIEEFELLREGFETCGHQVRSYLYLDI